MAWNPDRQIAITLAGGVLEAGYAYLGIAGTTRVFTRLRRIASLSITYMGNPTDPEAAWSDGRIDPDGYVTLEGSIKQPIYYQLFGW